MPRKDFEIISVLGPLGAGKTTTLNRLIEHVPLSDSYAVVVNDVGENNIDAQRIWDHPANRSERIIPLTAGCIGCSDITQFREALELVHDSGVNVLFIEPTGIAPGTEIADVVRSSGFDLSILTLVNAQTVQRDLKWQVLPSQIAVADVIGITHIPNGSDEAQIMETVLEQLPPLPHEVSVELIKPGSTNYFDTLAKLRGIDRELRIGKQTLHICCGGEHHHDHSHHEHDNHGISAKSFKLKKSVNIEQIEQLLRPYANSDTTPLLRAKGVVGTQRFDAVGGEWNTQIDDSGAESNANIIFGGHIPTTLLDAIQKLSKEVDRAQITGDKKSIVKSISNMSIEDRVAIVNDRITQYPSPISATHGELIPDCEADEGYEIAFWGNNDDIPSDTKNVAMEAYIEFRLHGLHELLHHGKNITNADTKAAYWLRRYGATLGYNGYYLADYISESNIAKIREHNPAQILADGLLELDSLTFDEGRAEEKPEFIKGVLQVALEHRHIDSRVLATLKAHILPMAAKNSEFAMRWDKVFATLNEIE